MGMILFRLLACARNSEVGMDLYDSPSIFHDFPSRWYTPTLIKFKFKSSPQMHKPEVLLGCQYSSPWLYRTKGTDFRTFWPLSWWQHRDRHWWIKRATRPYNRNVDCPRSGPGPVRALFADPGPGPQVQVQSFSDLDLDMSTAVYWLIIIKF